MIGKKISNYKIIRLIGKGGMAKVYEAENITLGTRVAIKILDESLSNNESIRQRFKNEARIMAGLQHQNIVNVIDFVETNTTLAIIMELLEGKTLTEYINEKGKLSLKESIIIFKQVLSAFDFAHQKGVIHRDIKPSNIFIITNRNNLVKILDFGIAKLVSSDSELTNPGTQMGTPVYMSPEQVQDVKNIDNLSDIYSLGVVFYFMLNGKPPYNKSTMSKFDIFSKIVHEPVPALKKYPEFNKIIQKATQKEPSKRYLTCRKFLEDINRTYNNQSNQKKSESKPITTIKKNIPDTKTKKTYTRKKVSKKKSVVKPSTKKPRKYEKRRKQNNNLKGYLIGLIVITLIGAGIFFGKDFFNKKSDSKTEITKKKAEKKQSEKPITFDKILHTKFPVDTRGIIVINDNKLSLTGTADTYNGKKPYLVFIDKKGKKNAEYTIDSNDNDIFINTSLMTNDDNLMYAGYQIDEDDNISKFIIKSDKKGKKIWYNSYGTRNGEINKIIKTNDNNYLLAGYETEYGVDKALLIKIDNNGKQIWKKTFKYSNDKVNVINSVCQVSANEYIAVGYTIQKHNSSIYLIKFDDKGKKIFEKKFDNNIDKENAKNIIKIDDNNFLIIGYATLEGKSRDGLVVKIDENANKVWSKSFGGTSRDEFNAVTKTPDNEYILVGYTRSKSNSSDFWIVKIDSKGNKKWEKYFGDNKTDIAYDIKYLSDDTFIVLGTSVVNNKKLPYMIKLNSNGKK